MKEEITYIACDGKRFYDEDACLEYEASLRNDQLDGKIYFWNLNREPLPLSTHTAEHIFFIYVKDKSAVPCACEIFDEAGGEDPWRDTPPENNALYYYDTVTDDWCLYDHDFNVKMWKMVNDTVGCPVFAEPRIRDLLERCMDLVKELAGDSGDALYFFENRMLMTEPELRDLGWGYLYEEVE